MQKIKITNPVIWADVPDVCVIRVEDVYYMVSTSMHSMPGCPIMKSSNLMNWEIVNYVFETLEDNDSHNLQHGKNIYGNGSWAVSLRYHNGKFYACFSCNDMDQFYIYHTTDIENGIWERVVIEGLLHDPSLLFDEDSVFVIYGNGDIQITELTADVTKIKPDGVHQLLLETKRDGIGLRCEGCHAYKLNGYYYLFFIEWPKTGLGMRRQLVYRSRELLGPYEYKIILEDDMGYFNNGVAQGGIIDSLSGEWYAVLFQDHGSVGRTPCVLPLSWEEDWPVIGIDRKAPISFEASLPVSEPKPLVISDDFNCNENKLALNWQWNHNPDHTRWSLTDRPEWLRLKTGQSADSVEYARNTLTQRTEGPACSGEVLLDMSGMKAGDYAGLVALASQFGAIGITVNEEGQRQVALTIKGDQGVVQQVASIDYQQDQIYLKIYFDFKDSVDKAYFYYSSNGEDWNIIGTPLQMRYTLDHFMGYRIGLFNYTTKQSGGYADFNYFHYIKYE